MEQKYYLDATDINEIKIFLDESKSREEIYNIKLFVMKIIYEGKGLLCEWWNNI